MNVLLRNQQLRNEIEISRIVQRIELINNEQTIKNEDIFRPVEDDGTLAIIVVQVHTRLQYLQQLIFSFSQVLDDLI